MSGSKIAAQIVAEMKIEEMFRKKYKRNEKCILDNKKQCDKCKYIEFCEDKD